ncbi:MAG: sugar kinase [Chitinophagaceae bacterium]|nr:sugar kinase [Chitinophagaceae bacterium]
MNKWTINEQSLSNKKYQILAVADLCLDILVTGPVQPQFNQVELLADNYSLDLGGSVGIFASQFSKLGGNIALIGKTGNDAAGEFILKRLQHAGVDTGLIAICENKRTSMGLNLYCKNDRAMLTYLGVMELITPALFTDELVSAAHHWHIGGYFLLEKLIPGWPAWLRRLKLNGVTISLDSNWDPSGQWNNIAELLPMVDVFLPNEAEAMALAGKTDIMESGRLLADLCPLVVIKNGEKGAFVFQDNHAIHYPVPAELVKDLSIVDTTGAGDNFDAGFMYAWLSNKEISVCMEKGFRCAVSSLMALGGIENQIVKT